MMRPLKVNLAVFCGGLLAGLVALMLIVWCVSLILLSSQQNEQRVESLHHFGVGARRHDVEDPNEDRSAQ